METYSDDWLAPDKFQHILFSFSLTILSSLLASKTPFPILRRLSIFFGSLVSLAAGTAKEVADEIGFFESAGASFRDAVADLVGIVLAVLLLSLSKTLSLRIRPDQSGKAVGLEIV